MVLEPFLQVRSFVFEHGAESYRFVQVLLSSNARWSCIVPEIRRLRYLGQRDIKILFPWPRKARMARWECMSECELHAETPSLKRQVQIELLARDMGSAADKRTSWQVRTVIILFRNRVGVFELAWPNGNNPGYGKHERLCFSCSAFALGAMKTPA